MKPTALCALLLCLCLAGRAQKPGTPPDTLTPTLLANDSIKVEQLLRLPDTYTVSRCDITIQRGLKNGELFRVFYFNSPTPSCINVNSNNFSALWRDQVRRLATSGSKVTIGEVMAVKGDREVKLMPKSFIVP